MPYMINWIAFLWCLTAHCSFSKEGGATRNQREFWMSESGEHSTGHLSQPGVLLLHEALRFSPCHRTVLRIIHKQGQSAIHAIQLKITSLTCFAKQLHSCMYDKHKAGPMRSPAYSKSNKCDRQNHHVT